MQTKAYWISEVAELTGININTIRKYCLLLEQNGYRFARDEQDRRAFTPQDVIVIEEIARIKKSDKLSLDESVSRVAEMYSKKEGPGIMPSIIYNAHNDEKNLVVEGIKAQLDSITKRMDEMVKFNESLVTELEKRDKEHYKRFDELMNAQLETRRMIAAAQESPKKKWYQIWQ